MVEIPRSLNEMLTSIAKSKELLTRLEKGASIIEEAYQEKSLARAFEATRLYNELAAELLGELEHSLFMNECLTTGKTVLINRKGRPINIDDYVKGEAIPVNLFALKSMQQLKEVFGEENMVDVEFK